MYSLLIMHKQIFTLVLTAALLPAALLPLPAQTDPDKPAARVSVGKVDVDFRYGKLTPGLWHLTGRVKMTTDNYDLAGEDLRLVFAGGKGGASALVKATADGSAAAGIQVVATIRQPLQGQEYVIHADHAVYLPDSSRPGGGSMTFTGHVNIVTRSGFLAGPSVSTTDQATLLLGSDKTLYPQLETGPAHLTLTPAQ